MKTITDIYVSRKRSWIKAFIAFSTLLIIAPAVWGTTFKASLDSTYILMGKKTALKFSIVTDGSPEGKVIIDKDSLPAEVEFNPVSEAVLSRTALGNGRYELKGEYIIQSFDSGDYRIPGLLFVTTHDTIASNPVNLRVIPVETEPDQDIYTELPPLEPGRKFFDWLPSLPSWWYWIVIGIVIIAAGIILYLVLSKKVVIKLPTKAPEPPYNIARRQLDELKREKLWESGQDKTYYTRLTDILRTYLHGRFGINAMELTSSQILSAIKALNLNNVESGNVKELLSTADFVKFAKLSPELADNIKSYNLVDEFIESTKPVVADEQSDNSQANNDLSEKQRTN